MRYIKNFIHSFIYRCKFEQSVSLVSVFRRYTLEEKNRTRKSHFKKLPLTDDDIVIRLFCWKTDDLLKLIHCYCLDVRFSLAHSLTL